MSEDVAGPCTCFRGPGALSANVEQVRNAHWPRPFKPIVIGTASGERYAIRHSETVWQSPGGHTVTVGLKGEEIVMIDIDHLTEFVFTARESPARGSK